MAGAAKPTVAALQLFIAVRDEISPQPYVACDEPETHHASSLLEAKRSYCVGNATLSATARAGSAPARVASADVRDHLASARLLELPRTDFFIYHGIA